MNANHQDTLDHSDLLLGRMTRAFDGAVTTLQQAKQLITERDAKLKEKDEEIEKHKARVAELEGILADLADEDDEESDD